MATNIRKEESKRDGENIDGAYRCFHTCMEYVANHFCGNLNCCDQMKNIGCPHSGKICDQCLNAVMAWGTDAEYLSKTAKCAEKGSIWDSYDSNADLDIRANEIEYYANQALKFEGKFESATAKKRDMMYQKEMLESILEDLKENIDAGDIEAPAKIGIVMDDVVNNPKVCQNVRNNLNSVITREGRKTRSNCHEPKRLV